MYKLNIMDNDDNNKCIKILVYNQQFTYLHPLNVLLRVL